MLKIRLQGTKNDIRWFIRLLQRDKRLDLENVSTFFNNAGAERYKRVYAEVHRIERVMVLIKSRIVRSRKLLETTMLVLVW
jgi:hypothetical protein